MTARLPFTIVGEKPEGVRKEKTRTRYTQRMVASFYCIARTD
ncbi:hypothetical protein ALTERO38_60431 [Alteromonas sp. 38]|nr:hypothetical protein ALTER154_40363 [Alteromonas sp. 154]VXC21364.1 hypothetical protein ALTERO38_60431 [Alteromonas sp. 38]